MLTLVGGFLVDTIDSHVVSCREYLRWRKLHGALTMRQLTTRKGLRLFTYLWYSFCLCVLISWWYVRLNIYFQYRTSIKTAFFTPKTWWAPRVSLCFSLQSLLVGSTDYYFSDQEQSEDDMVFVNKTIGQLFDSTPHINDTIESCSYRDFDYNSLIRLDSSSECFNQYFNRTKYRMNGYMCYMYSPWKEYEYSLYSVNYAVNDNRVMFTLTMNDSLAAGHRICPLVHYDSYPFDDRNFNKEILLPINSTRMYYLSYDLVIIKRLPAPFQSRCADEGVTACLLRCSEDVHFKYSVASSIGISFSDHRQYRMPGYRGTYSGRGINDMFEEAVEVCGPKRCSHEKCLSYLVKTIVSSNYQAVYDNKLTFIVKNAGHPPFMMKFVPKYQLVDLLTELGSLAGAILGFSILATVLLLFTCTKRSDKKITVGDLKLLAMDINMMYCSLRLNKMALKENSPSRAASRLRKYTPCINLLIKATILGGFIFQVTNVSQVFFSYKVFIKINYEFNPVITQYPKGIFCFDLLRLLNSRRWPLTSGANYETKYSEKASLINDTLANLMKRTPASHSLITGCRLRSSGKHQMPLMKRYNASYCKQKFEFKRFYFNGNICYQLSLDPKLLLPDDNGIVVQHFVSSHLVHPGILYTVIFDDTFVETRKLEAILYHDNLDTDTNAFSVEFYPTMDSHLLGLVSCHLLDYSLLPAPYETNCGLTSSSECRKKCFVKHAKKFNRLPRSPIFNETEDLNLKIIDFDDLSDENFYRTWTQIEDECQNKCKRDDCVDQKCIVYEKKSDRSKEKFEIAVTVYDSPIWYIRAHSAFSIYDFVYNVQCCLSFWLGVEYINLNPAIAIRIWQRRKKKMSTTQVNFVAINKLLQMINRSIDSAREALMKRSKFISCCYAGLGSSLQARRKIIFIFALLIPFILHLTETISYYFLYPTVMNLDVRPEESYHLLEYEVAVCMNVKEIFLRGRNFTREEKESVLDGKKIGELFAMSPDKDELISGCGFRGLDGVGMVGRVGDKFFYTEVNATHCRKVLRSKRYLFKDFICYQYGQQASGDDVAWFPLNERNLLMMVGLNSSLLTKEMSLGVGMSGTYPNMSGIWTPTAIREDTPYWYTITYSKYIQNTLPSQYSQDGFENNLYGLCCIKCYNQRLVPMGFIYSGLNEENADIFNLTFFTAIHRRNPILLNAMRRIRNECRHLCSKSDLFSHEPHYYYLSSEIADMGNQSFYQIEDSHTFYLQRSVYPVMIVIFRPEITFFQLVIVCGSILSFWFGLTMNMMSAPFEEQTSKFQRLSELRRNFDRIIARLISLHQLTLLKKRHYRTVLSHRPFKAPSFHDLY